MAYHNQHHWSNDGVDRAVRSKLLLVGRTSSLKFVNMYFRVAFAIQYFQLSDQSQSRCNWANWQKATWFICYCRKRIMPWYSSLSTNRTRLQGSKRGTSSGIFLEQWHTRATNKVHLSVLPISLCTFNGPRRVRSRKASVSHSSNPFC